MSNRANSERMNSTLNQSGMRIALLTEYDGTDFSGFQIQKNERTVQACLEEAIFHVYGTSCRIYGSSRTDAGVHARGHISHVDVPFVIPEERIPFALNTKLPADLCVHRAKSVPGTFHARFSAKGKRYVYRIFDGRIRPCIDRRYGAHVLGRLDIDRMQKAALMLVGIHDFTAFSAQSKNDPPLSPIRTIRQIDVRRNPHLNTIDICVEGESFLYHMVRIIAGTLVYIGQGKMQLHDVAPLFAHKDRRKAGKTMPACGLVLEKVFYEPDLFGEKGV